MPPYIPHGDCDAEGSDHSSASTSIFNPLSSHYALKHHTTSIKTDLIFLRQRVLEYWFTNTWQFSVILKPHQVIFIHYKSRIATAFRGL